VLFKNPLIFLWKVRGFQFMSKNNSGLTLMEVMIVVMIIGLLASIAFPNYTLARNNTRTRLCVNNLRLIYSAKEQWAMDNSAAQGAAVAAANITPYLKGNAIPVEPGGGSYTIGDVGANPTCSVGGSHAL
jgi:prepilin-type N-terminal cleavage/methylation domain-containing protein